MSGASGRLTIRTLRPFGSVRSITWLVRLTSCARVGTSQAAATRTSPRETNRRCLMFTSRAVEG